MWRLGLRVEVPPLTVCFLSLSCPMTRLLPVPQVSFILLHKLALSHWLQYLLLCIVGYRGWDSHCISGRHSSRESVCAFTTAFLQTSWNEPLQPVWLHSSHCPHGSLCMCSRETVNAALRMWWISYSTSVMITIMWHVSQFKMKAILWTLMFTFILKLQVFLRKPLSALVLSDVVLSSCTCFSNKPSPLYVAGSVMNVSQKLISNMDRRWRRMFIRLWSDQIHSSYPWTPELST